MAEWLGAGRQDSMTVAWRENRLWNVGHLRADVTKLVSVLQCHPAQRWALCFEDCYQFLVALLACLHAGKTPVIPGHARISSLLKDEQVFDGLLTPQRLPLESGNQIVLPEVLSGAGAAMMMLAPLRSEQAIELFTSGSTGRPKRVVKTVGSLDAEARLLSSCFGARLQGCQLLASVVPQHLYGLTFRVVLPMSLGIPAQAGMLDYPEQLAGQAQPYVLISSPAFLKRLGPALPVPPAAMIFSAGGALHWQDAQQSTAWLGVAPDEIYGSTETGVIAHRHRAEMSPAWQLFPGMALQSSKKGWRLCSPLLPDDAQGMLLDDELVRDADGGFHLLGRRDRVVKIEEKRVSLPEVERLLRELPGIRDVATLPMQIQGRQLVGVVVVLDAPDAQRWYQGEALQMRQAWRNALHGQLDPVAIPRRWRVMDRLPVDSMGKLVQDRLKGCLHDA